MSTIESIRAIKIDSIDDSMLTMSINKDDFKKLMNLTLVIECNDELTHFIKIKDLDVSTIASKKSSFSHHIKIPLQYFYQNSIFRFSINAKISLLQPKSLSINIYGRAWDFAFSNLK